MDWRDKLNELKSEVPQVKETPAETIIKPAKKRQSEPLRVELDKRKGKTATLVTEFQGMDSELKELAKTLKVKWVQAVHRVTGKYWYKAILG